LACLAAVAWAGEAHMGCRSSSIVEGPKNHFPIAQGMSNAQLYKQGVNVTSYIISVPNGIKNNTQTFFLTHVWGSPYQQGFAYGQAMNEQVNQFVNKAWDYLQDSFAEALEPYLPTWVAKKIADVGMDVTLDFVYDISVNYTTPDFYEELQGVADGSGVDYLKLRRLHMLPGLTKGACSMFGAWGASVPNPNSLLQLRALDWDMDGPFRDYVSITVYHPDSNNKTQGHNWLNMGFTGFIGGLTGVSETQLGISEIGVSFQDDTWGPEQDLVPIPGIPFIVLLRDILKYDNTIDDAISRMATATRTCNLILGVGDGKLNEFRAFQYGPYVFNVFDDLNQQPVADWHPRIDDLVYYGMDWDCPTFDELLAQQLVANYGNITAASSIWDITSVLQSGDLHLAFYDLTDMNIYVAFAAPHNVGGPTDAYARQYTFFDVNKLFTQPIPSASTAHKSN